MRVLPTPVTLEQLNSEADQAVANENYSEAAALASVALRIAPLDWDAYQTRATAQSSEEQTVHRLDRDQVSVAFQGAPGAFSEDAAVKLLGQEIALVPRPTFESLFKATDDGSAEYVLAPIENSLAGFVQPSFDHLLDSRLFIIGEVIIPIAQCLIGCPGSSFEMIAAVESHPVALDQCRRFLSGGR